VHVAQRFPVKILIDHPDPQMFRIGTSAVAVLQPDRRDDRNTRDTRATPNGAPS
jgi:multidrug efflux system membrane fusion protein